MRKKACELTDWKIYYHIGTLAASYARDGNYDEAEKYQKMAIELVPKGRLNEFYSRLRLYQYNRPYQQGKTTSIGHQR